MILYFFHAFQDAGFLGSRFFKVQVFLGPGFSGSRFFRFQVFQGSDFSGSKFFRVQVFQGSSSSGSRFSRIQVFQGPGYLGSKFFRVQIFLGPGFSGSRFSRVQGPGPSFRSSPLTEKNCVLLNSIQEFIEIQCWLLLTFFICLYDQLSSIHSILHINKETIGFKSLRLNCCVIAQLNIKMRNVNYC